MNLQRLSPQPSGQGSRAAIDTQSDFRKRSQLNAETVSFLYCVRSKRQSTNGKEFDTYKVATVANSTSTMHKIASAPITRECFEIDDFHSIEFEGGEIDTIINYCENLRQEYLKTNDKKVWKELIRWLPESFLQKRTVTMNYENLLGMCSKGQRRFHKLNEWSGIDDNALTNFIQFVRKLPYAQDLIFIDEEIN